MFKIIDYKILLVDDQKDILLMIETILRREGFTKIFTSTSCYEAITNMRTIQPDCAILDITLPDGDGFELFAKIKSISPIPILFLTAKDQIEDKLIGLGLGADDYLTKPFLPKELVLRLCSILRRTYIPFNSSTWLKPAFHLGECFVDFNTGNITKKSKEFVLTAKEFEILEVLYTNHGKIVSPDILCQAAWGDSSYGYENTLMVHIHRLRTKIEEFPSTPQYLLTVKGLGYKLILEI